jgi:cystathionine beta-lyase
MTFDFDRQHDRQGTFSVKWEFLVRRGEANAWDGANPAHGDKQVLPMWVADMDFEVAPVIKAALQALLEHGIFGYTRATSDYTDSIVKWMRDVQGWEAKPQWMMVAPGVVPALNHAVRAFTSPDDKVLIQRPVYYPFTYAPNRNGRDVVSSNLRFENGRYEMDFEDLAAKAADPAVTMAILCSPHNPVGRLWTAEELERFARICVDNDVFVIADEIHGDLVMPGHSFVSYGTLPSELVENSIICTAASKSFNLAGLHTCNLFVPNAERREQLANEFFASGTFGQNPFGLIATQAAYDAGRPWLDAVLAYIHANVKHLAARLESVDGLEMLVPEATYLVWIDCRELGITDRELSDGLFDEARLYLDDGNLFGPEGEGFTRINVACPRALLDKAIDRLIAFAERVKS